MIYVNAPLKQDDIIQALENNSSEIDFKFEKKDGLKLTFSVNTDDLDEAVSTAKMLIKETPFGSVLSFNVTKS